MDPDKLNLLRERDDVWAEARDAMPLFEKFFNGETSDQEEGKIGWISIQLMTIELNTYKEEIENISKDILDFYSKEIKSGEIDTLKFANKEIRILKEKIIKVGEEENTREEVEANLEDIRKYIRNIRLIFLYNISKYYDIIGDMFLDILEKKTNWCDKFTKEEQAAIARCKILTYYLLLLEESEIESLDGSWFK